MDDGKSRIEDESNSTGDRATRFEYQEALVNIERSRFRMFVHHAFLCTGVRFGLQIVDHQMSFDRTAAVVKMPKPESLPASVTTLIESVAF
jgi:hypothetical protein